MTSKKFAKEASFALGITVFGGILTGALWANLSVILVNVAGLMAIVPVIGQMRGNISGIFTSRIGTGLHLGSIKASFADRSKELMNTIYMNLSLSIITPLWVSLIVFLLHILSGGSTPFINFIIISFVAGVIAALLQIIITLFVAFLIYKKGMDPDVLAYPVLSVTADFITSAAILIAYTTDIVVISFNITILNFVIELMVIIVLISFLVVIYSRQLRSKFEFDLFNLLRESIPIIFGSVIIGGIVGIIMNDSIPYVGILIILPVYMAYTGSMGAIVGSKFTTAYYLGSLTTREGKIDTYLMTPLILTGIGILLSFGLAIITFVIASIFGLSLPNQDLITLILICLFTGISTTSFSILNALIVGNITFHKGIDADNIIVPLTSTLGDLVAILAIVFSLSLAH